MTDDLIDLPGGKYTDTTILKGLAPDGQYKDIPVSSDGQLQVSTYNGITSTDNSTSTALGAGATWTGAGENVVGYGSVVVASKSDVAGTLYMEFSPDGTNWDSSLSFVVAANVNEVHRLSVTRAHFRVRYVNGASPQTYFRLQSTLSNAPPLTSALNSTVQSDADSLVTRSVLMGETDGGQFKFVPVTTEGHLEVAVHDPLLPFGSVHVEKMSPVFQVDGVYGLNNSTSRVVISGTGTVAGANNLLISSTGTTIYSAATLQSRKRLRYRPGQGSIGRFTSVFSAPATDSTLIAGLGTSESGFYFGYNGTAFGVLHVTDGVREIQTFTVTTPSTGTQNVQVVLDGVTYTVTGMTNNGSTLRTAYEIAKGGTWNGWSVESIDSTVVFVSGARPLVGAFSVAQSGAGVPVAGSFVETLAGVSSTDTWVAQTAWNGDKLDGTGASGFVLNPQFGNIYQIDMQYLGFGNVNMKVRVVSADNNATWVTAHTFVFPNALTTPHSRQPSMPFTQTAYSAGSTTNVSVATGSFAGFVEGEIVLNGPRMTYDDVSTVVSTGAYYALMTVRNDLVFGGRPNQAIVNLLSMGGAHDDATPVTLYLIKNGTLVGTPNFLPWSTSSVTCVDTAATQVTITDNEQILFSLPLGQAGSALFTFEDNLMIQPGETVTLAAKAVTGTATYTIVTLNTREDQ